MDDRIEALRFALRRVAEESALLARRACVNGFSGDDADCVCSSCLGQSVHHIATRALADDEAGQTTQIARTIAAERP